jgi:hypothetical protein
LRCSNLDRDKLHSTVSANWPITIGLTGRKAERTASRRVWKKLNAQGSRKKRQEYAASTPIPIGISEASQEPALWRALFFDAGPAPRM